MNNIFKKRQVSFLIQLLILTIILVAVHSYLAFYFVREILFFSFWQVYIFHFVVTLLVYSVINYQDSIGKKQIFNSFMISTILKMILAILFLLPLLMSTFENKKPDVFNFFIPDTVRSNSWVVILRGSFQSSIEGVPWRMVRVTCPSEVMVKYSSTSSCPSPMASII